MSFNPHTNSLEAWRDSLPPHTKLAKLPDERSAYISSDIDGDGTNEIIAVYEEQGELWLIMLKEIDGKWSSVIRQKGNGSRLTHLSAAPITGGEGQTIILGWYIEGLWSELNLLNWSAGALSEMIARGTFFSKLEVEDMASPPSNGKDGIHELALWVHAAGKAYKVEVYRWSSEGLKLAEDTYPYYFRKVIHYYENLLKETPRNSVYWYYLADAQVKAGQLRLAIRTIDYALTLSSPYPSKEELLKLKQRLLAESSFPPRRIFRNVGVKKIDAGHYSVAGEASVFQGIVGYEVLEKGMSILQSSTLANASGPAWGRFSMTVIIKEKPITAYALVLFEPAPADGSVPSIHTLTIPLTASR